MLSCIRHLHNNILANTLRSRRLPSYKHRLHRCRRRMRIFELLDAISHPLNINVKYKHRLNIKISNLINNFLSLLGIIKYVLTNESTWSLLYNLYTKSSWCMGLIRVAINRYIAFRLERPIHPAIIFIPNWTKKCL